MSTYPRRPRPIPAPALSSNQRPSWCRDGSPVLRLVARGGTGPAATNERRWSRCKARNQFPTNCCMNDHERETITGRTWCKFQSNGRHNVYKLHRVNFSTSLHGLNREERGFSQYPNKLTHTLSIVQENAELWYSGLKDTFLLSQLFQNEKSDLVIKSNNTIKCIQVIKLIVLSF